MAYRVWLDGFWSLEDLLCEGLAALFVGYNPNPLAVERQHYYARKGNHFWEDLHACGLVPGVLRGLHEDRRILEFGLGLTDVVKRPTPTMDDLLAAEFQAGFERLQGLVARYRPAIVCFNGLGLQDRYRKSGLKLPTEVVAIPSSSPRNNGLRQRRLQELARLAQRIAQLRQ
ncbi:MAG: mismatch-specific DNA-glycosylase [Cyanobacteria bacterium REEB65]|nr:mismatch-specific DNA-glycosylase [Cyanobacteria bacterium REEB65]